MNTDFETIGGFPATGNVPLEDAAGSERREETPFGSIGQQYKAAADRYFNDVRDAFARLHVRHKRLSAYLRGQQFTDIDPETGEMYEVRPADRFAIINNQYESFIDTKVSTISSSGRKLVAKCTRPDPQQRARLRDVQHWVNADVPFEVDDELVHGYQWVLRGEVWWINAPVLSGPNTIEPVTKPTQLSGGAAAYWCPDCEKGGYLDEQAAQSGPGPGAFGAPGPQMPNGAAPVSGSMGEAQPALPAQGPGAAGMAGAPTPCPQCGGMNLDVATPEAATVESVIGYRSRPSAKIKTETVDSLEMYWYARAKKPSLSPWIERRRHMLACDVQAKFPNFQLGSKSTNSMSEQAVGPDIESEMSMAVAGHSADPWETRRNRSVDSGGDLTVLVREVWLRPNELHRIKTKQDVVLQNGKSWPAGTRMDQIFPKGSCATYIDDRLADVRGCDLGIDDEIIYVPAKLNPEYGFPRASESLLANQDRINFIDTYELMMIAMNAAGLLVFDADTFKSAQLRKKLGQPGAAVAAENLLPNERITDKIERVTGSGPMMNIAETRAATVGFMQAQNGTFGVNPLAVDSGGPATLDTATGVNAVREVEKRMQQPMLKLLAAGRGRLATARFRMAQKYCVDEQYFETKDPGGRDTGRDLVIADIDGDFYIVPDEAAYESRTNAEERQDAVAALNLGVYLPDAPPEQRRLLSKVFGIDELSESDYLTWQEKAHDRLERMKEESERVWPQAEQQIPMAIQAIQEMAAEGMPTMTPDGQPLDPVKLVVDFFAAEVAKIDEHDERDKDMVFMDVFRDYWSTAEAERDNPIMQRAGAMAFQARKQHMIEMQVQDQMMAAQGAAPLAAMQMEQEDQVASTAAEREERAKDADAFRNEQSSQKQREHEMALAKQKGGSPKAGVANPS